jgi:hypothetical protein
VAVEADLTLTVGDRNESLTYTVVDSGGDAVNLSGWTVTFSMWDADTGTVVVDAVSATVVTAASGVVRYDWVAADVDTAGRYHGRFTGTDGSGKTLTSPVASFLVIDIFARATGAEGSYVGPNASVRDQVRFLLQDTGPTWTMSDDEIDWLVVEWGENAYLAAAGGADILSSRYAGDGITTKKVGDLTLTTDNRQLAAHYGELGARLRAIAARANVPVPSYDPDALMGENDEITGVMDNRVI